MPEGPSLETTAEQVSTVTRVLAILSFIRLSVKISVCNSCTPYSNLNSNECVQLANWHKRNGAHDKIILLLTEAIIKDPNNFEAMCQYAVLNKKEHPQVSLDMCNDILKINPDFTAAFLLRLEMQCQCTKNAASLKL